VPAICTTLNKGCGCSKQCLNRFSINAIKEIRTQFWSIATEVERTNFLVGILQGLANATKKETDHIRLTVNGMQVCKKAFRLVFGISQHKMREAMLLLQEGRNKEKPTDQYKISRTTEKSSLAFAWFQNYLNENGDNGLDGRIHLVSYLTFSQIYDIYSADITEQEGPQKMLSFNRFCNFIKSSFSNVVRPRNNRLGHCSTCVQFSVQRRNAHGQALKQLRCEMAAHSELHRAERWLYHQRRYTAKLLPYQYMSIIIDAPKPLELPNTERSPKEQIARLPISMEGLINHSERKRLLSLILPLWPHDPNRTMTVIFDHIREIAETKPLPPTLYVQGDNCSADNKNISLFGLFSLLIYHRWFEEIILSFLIPGHTHEDIDQMFSTWEIFARNETIETIPQFINLQDKIYRSPDTCPSTISERP